MWRFWILLALLLSLSCSCIVIQESAPQPDAHPPPCDYHGTLYDDGVIFPAGDGCNGCKCNPNGNTQGEWGCSAIACLNDAGPPDSAL
jgi:hypothetical protein